MIIPGPKSQKAWNDFTKTGKVADYLNFTNVRNDENKASFAAKGAQNSSFCVQGGKTASSANFGATLQ